MNIFYLITRAEQGGAQTNVLSLAKAAKAAGHGVRIGTGGKGWLTERAEGAGVKVVILPGLRRSLNLLLLPSFLIGLRRELRREAADIIHLHSSNALFGALAARTLGKSRPKIIATVHGLSVLDPGWRGNGAVQAVCAGLMRWLWSLCDRLIFVCRSDLNHALKHRLVKARPDATAVIPNGIGAVTGYREREQARAELGLSAKEPRLVVGTVARLDYQKDMGLFLRVAEKFRGENVAFVIVGDGPDRLELREEIVRRGLGELVRIHAQARDGYKLMPAFDVFVMTSRYEGLPYTLLEAGLATLPTVAVSVGGVPEVIEDGATGVLVHGRDAAILADGIKCLLGEPARRQALGSAARHKIMTDFSEQKMAARTLELYEDVILKR